MYLQRDTQMNKYIEQTYWTKVQLYSDILK